MKLVIHPAAAPELLEPDNCRAFSAAFAPSVPNLDRPAAVTASQAGELDADGNHLFVSVDLLRRLAAGRVGPSWDDEFSGMLAYAGTKGWMNEAGDRVRAHIEQ